MMIVSHQSTVNSYHNSALSNPRLHYLVTYSSNEIMLIVHK